jgi:hypothetical protein
MFSIIYSVVLWRCQERILMITYDLILDRQRLIGADRFSVAANANETLRLRFDFDRHWRRFDSKAAVFRNSDGEYYIIEVKQNRVQVPWEVLKKTGFFELSLIGYEEEKVISSEMVEIEVAESLLPEDYKTFSPSEVLFDRFKRECFAEAYLEYEDEISELKSSHLAEMIKISQEIKKSEAEHKAQLSAKDETISQMEFSHEIETNELRSQLAEKNDLIELYKEKADKWDLVDYAVSLKTTTNQPLWSWSKDSFELPMLNTSSIVTFTASNFDSKLKGIGLDLTSTTSVAGLFSSHKSIERLELRNTGNVTSFASLIESCPSIKTVTIDNMDACGTLSRFAYDASNLLFVRFGTDVVAGAYENCFSNCRLLKEIDGCFDMQYATKVSNMFFGCHSLETVRLKEDSLCMSIDFSWCHNLSKESFNSIFRSLSPDHSGSLSISQYAFETQFSEEEQSEWIDYITDTKSWALSMA